MLAQLARIVFVGGIFSTQLWAVEINYSISGFKKLEEPTIVQAVEIVAARFLDRRTQTCMEKRSTRGLILPDYWRWRARYGLPRRDEAKLIQYQLSTLRKALKNKNYVFPLVEIEATYERWALKGRVPFSQGAPYVVPMTSKIYGHFWIELNTFHKRSASDWAGTIAHEMLHILGHNHAGDSSTAEIQTRQISVFQNCLRNDFGTFP